MPSQTLDQILEGRRSQPNQLIEVLQDVQENYGYIPEEAMRAAAEGLGVPLMEVYRVVSFYKAFKLQPCGRNHLIMCMGTACHVRGARLLLEQAVAQFGVSPGEVTPDGLFSVEHVNCLGACALGPQSVGGITDGRRAATRHHRSRGRPESPAHVAGGLRGPGVRRPAV